MSTHAPHIAIIGAGIGGLAAALRLSYAGQKVTVFDSHAGPGGKMRTIPSIAGPVDAGPTVLTMKPVFEALFADVGEMLEDHVTLCPESILARHFWSDGTQLDLMANPAQSRANVASAFGEKVAREFDAFSARAARLFNAFDAPLMRSASPSQMTLTKAVLSQPSLIAAMDPLRSLSKSLSRQFSEPKLAQLFGRYATYVGGRPDASPAILSLISHSEAQGVWHVQGGMHQLARAIEKLARQFGAAFRYNSHIDRITPQQGGAFHVQAGDETETFNCVLYNGDPRALQTGHLGHEVSEAVTAPTTEPRSLSAYVHAFAAKASGVDLAAHNVFFGDDPNGEFGPLAKGQMPHDPTLYICAQDRFGGQTPTEEERFEIIMNGAPAPDSDAPNKEEISQCQTLTMTRLRSFGLTFSPSPTPSALTTPAGFAALFPMSNGSLYGRSPHGMMAAFKRPTARTMVPGFYLVGGGAHPGAGVPMATLSARHAAEAILTDLTSTSRSRPQATHGGTSTGSATTAAVPSRSSPL